MSSPVGGHWLADGEDPPRPPSLEALAAEVMALNQRVAELEARPPADPKAVAEELDRLRRVEEALPATQARRYAAMVRDRDR